MNLSFLAKQDDINCYFWRVGNEALANGEYEKAIEFFILAKEAMPQLANALDASIKLAKHKQKYTVLSKPSTKKESIDIVVPVYNALEDVQACLTSLEENTDNFRVHIFVINDASNEETTKWLQDFCKDKEIFTLIENPENLGYTKSINIGLRASTADYVITQNSDTIVTSGWLTGMVRCMQSDEKIGIVGPLSNAAGWQSVPKVRDETTKGFVVNELPEGITLSEMSQLVSSISQRTYPKIPIINGFCFMISRTVIDSIGYMDEENFPIGYGEENDYCIRAAEAGFTMAIASDVYVWHSKSKSFGKENKVKHSVKGSDSNKQKHTSGKYLKLQLDSNINLELSQLRVKIQNIFTEFNSITKTSIKNTETTSQLVQETDKHTLYPANIETFLEDTSGTEKSIAWFDHTTGGGTEVYTINNYLILKEKCIFIRIQNNDSDFYTITLLYKDITLKQEADNIIELERILKKANISSIVINNLYKYKDVLPVLTLANQLKKQYNIEVSYRAHDLYSICPRITMLTEKTTYCNISNLEECKNCTHSTNPITHIESVENWHETWRNFFANIADEIQVFSNSTKTIIEKLYPCTKNKILVIPHQSEHLKKVVVKPHKKINIGIIGNINPHKGAHIVREMDVLLEFFPHISIKVIGDFHSPLKPTLKKISVSGRYARNQLPEIIEKNEIDILLIPSVCPETFSYTTDEAMLMGIPVACFNLGAPAERVEKYKKGLIISRISPLSALYEIADFIYNLRSTDEAYSSDDNLRKRELITLLSHKSRILIEAFDQDYYIQTYQDVAKSKTYPFSHYVNYGKSENRKPCKLFPKEIIHREVKKRKIKDNNENFNISFYLESYYETAYEFLVNNTHPLKHYEKIGKKLGFVKSTLSLDVVKKTNSIDNYLFSIIIPVYKSAEYLEHCLNSAYAQSVKNLEVIIVNDGSPDNSQDIIDAFAQKYPEITKVIVHQKNQGLVQTHKDGISAATGDYFAILDGDDWLDLRFCEKLGKLAIAYEADCVCCLWTRPHTMLPLSSDKNDTYENLRILEGDYKIESLANWGNYPNIHYGLNRKLYNRASWNDIDPIRLKSTTLNSEDTIITNNFICCCERVVSIQNNLYHWFNNPTSLTNILTQKFIDDSFYAINYLFLARQSSPYHTALYERNVQNIFLLDFLERLQKSYIQHNKQIKELIEYFATLYDQNCEKFTTEQYKKIFDTTMSVYSKICSNLQITDKVFFLDAIGNTDIKYSLLKYWDKHSSIPYEYLEDKLELSLSKTLKRIEMGHTARLIVTTGGWGSNYIVTRPIVQLWHGMGAIKKVTPFPDRLIPSLAFCSSSHPLVMNVFKKLFKVSEEKLFPYGSIVADKCLDKNFIELQQNTIYSQFPTLQGKKIYLYAPTFRGRPPNLAPNDNLDFNYISSQLHENEILLVKYHPIVRQYMKNSTDSIDFPNIIDVTDFGNIIQFLSVSDAFITDYSSSIHHALLLNKPVCFLATDIDQYVKEQGILIDYRKEMPGDISETTDPDKILLMLRRAVANTPKYKEFKKKHLGGCDGNSRNKIINKITNLYYEVNK